MRGVTPGQLNRTLYKMTQLLLTALFALALSFLTFAASFAEAPRSQFVSVSGSHE